MHPNSGFFTKTGKVRPVSPHSRLPQTKQLLQLRDPQNRDEFNNFEKVAVIGRVGCGKSTLLNAITKEAFIQNGSITLEGTELKASFAE